jgi:hypothetical protein
MKRPFLVISGIALVGILAIAWILFSSLPPEELTWTVDDVLERPGLYAGKNITLEGEYRGWESGCVPTGPPVTRNDWQIKDETGCIYVTGVFPELDPYLDIGARVRVAGTLMANDMNAPYISAVRVEILDGNGTQPAGDESAYIDNIFKEPDEDILPPSLPS